MAMDVNNAIYIRVAAKIETITRLSRRIGRLDARQYDGYKEDIDARAAVVDGEAAILLDLIAGYDEGFTDGVASVEE
jgi:hypothetical protein